MALAPSGPGTRLENVDSDAWLSLGRADLAVEL
jgi:hypothetical protein